MEPIFKDFHLVRFPIEFLYAAIATVGGFARYFNSYVTGQTPFKFSILLASGFMAGFSGLMFALVGDSMHLPHPMPYILAGVGGFFGEQTMKLIMEYASKKVTK